MADRIDFKAIADAALRRADSLVPEWLPGGSHAGPEYKALNPMRADGKPGSFSINLNTGKWGDFATDDKGKDLVSLYAYLFTEGDNGLAARELAEKLGIPEAIEQAGRGERTKAARKPKADKPAESAPAEPSQEKAKQPTWVAMVPVPDDAPEPPKAHQFRGTPERVWTYRDAEGRLLGYVCRFRTSDGGKEVLPLTYCEAVTGRRAWRWQQWEEPRPMYGLDRLAERPDAPVLLVEGEKCADAPVDVLPEFVCASWPGGSKTVDKVDWSPLSGRSVLQWPDCDAQRERLTRDEKDAGIAAESKPILPPEKQPGIAAMEKIAALLLALPTPSKVRMVQIPEPGAKPGGWDVWDAIDEGADAEALRVMLRSQRPPACAEDRPAALATDDEAGAGKRVDLPPWKRGLIWDVFPFKLEDCRENVMLMLTRHPQWRGVVGWDEFARKPMKMRDTPAGAKAGEEWTREDDLELGLWLAQHERFLVKGEGTLTAGVGMAAMRNKFHPVRDYLNRLPKWDGVPRLDVWLEECLGAKAGSPEYLPLVGRVFILGMVYRVMQPGCQWDYMIIFEGAQGKGKSSALRVLGEPWYSDTHLQVGDKDAYMQLEGVWLYEIGEMDSFNRSEATAVKAFVTTRFDRFRPPYERRLLNQPRQVAFGGSTNQGEYIKDPTGARRFWPVRTCRIDLEKLRAWRDQLFAEALELYRQGVSPRPSREEEILFIYPEQEARQIVDPWIVPLASWLDDPERFSQKQFTSFELLTKAIGVDGERIDNNRAHATRIGNLMQKLGWPKRRRSTGLREWVYERPERPASTASSAASAPASNPPSDDSIEAPAAVALRF